MPATQPAATATVAPILALAAAVTLAAALPAAPQGATTRVSLRSTGLQGNARSIRPALSADGRYVAYESFAADLAPGDTNSTWDVFRRDRLTGEVRRVSIATGGAQANNSSSGASLSADGRFVAFTSHASNLAPGDTNGQHDVFVHDTQSGATTRVSLSSTAQQANGASGSAAISADGRYVAFESRAADLVPGDTNDAWDVFLHDRLSGQTRRVSVDSAGLQASSHSTTPALSADGRFVAFTSEASNLVPGDTNATDDVFVHDTLSGETTRVSLGAGGIQADDYSQSPSLSADGRYVAFVSGASNLVPGDTNGTEDVFVRDRQSGVTTRVSLATGGTQAGGPSFSPRISADGLRVAFESEASDLVATDTNGTTDVFLHERPSGQTSRASVASGGTQANGLSQAPSLSADGRRVAFHSLATNLAPDDFNSIDDVFLHDALTTTTSIESVCGRGQESNGEAWRTEITEDGRFVVFDSPADNLVAGDTNADWDVFLHERWSGRTERVSVGAAGLQTNGWSASGRVTPDGRFVAFDSMASNLVPGDTNGFLDVFVRDRWLGTTERVNLGPGGVQSNGLMSTVWDITPDGRYVAFSSTATNLVPGDTNGVEDVFVRDRSTGQTKRVSISTLGAQGNGSSHYASLSADGRYVAFHSHAPNLVPGDTNSASDVFVHDQLFGDTWRVSVHSSGAQGNGSSLLARISADGRFVAFQSLASSLVFGDSNGVSDVFVHDRQMLRTERVSIDSSGLQANGTSERPRISADGRRVAFRSVASNLVAGDTNGAHDIFVHDRSSGGTRRASVSSAGVQANGQCEWPALSPDGRFVASTSYSTTLVLGDTNNTSDAFVHDLEPLAPTPFCYGDGSEAACPCGNSGRAGRGCDNAQATGGVRLTATGSTPANDVVLHGLGYPPAAAPAVTVIRSPNVELAPVLFGDGLRCVGAQGLVRLGAALASGGSSSHPLNHGAGPGTFHYQLWYRSTPIAFCDPAAAFNLSSGLSLLWP